MQELQQNTTLQQSKLQQEVEKLTKELQIEKAKTAGNTHRMEEMKQLIRDKENLIQSLSKQVQQQQRHEKYTHFGGNGGTSSITNSGVGGNTGRQLHSQVTREIDSENRMSQLFDTLFDRLRHEVNFNMLGVPRYDPLTQSVNSTIGVLPSAMHPGMQPSYSELAKMPLPGEVNNTPALAGNNNGMGYGMNYSTDTILMARRLEEEKQRKQREEIEEALRQKKEQEELMKLKIEKEIRDKYDEENRNMMKTLQIQQKELEMKLENERKAKEQMEKDLLLQQQAQQRRMDMEKEKEQDMMKAQQREIAERLLRERQEEELHRRQEAEIALQQRLLEQQQLQQKEKELEIQRSQYYSGPVAIATSGVAAAAAAVSLNNNAVHYEHVSTALNPVSVPVSAAPLSHSVTTATSFAGLGLSTASISLVDSLAAPSFVNSPVVVRSTVTDDVAEETKRRVIGQEEQEAAARERQQREHEERERQQAEMERNRLEVERKRKDNEDARIAAELAAKQQKDEEDAAEREWQEMLARKREEEEAKRRKEQEELEKRLKQEEEERKEKERLRKEAEEAEAVRKREAESKRLKELEEQAEADRAAKRQEEEEQRRKEEEEKKKKDDEEAEIRAARERVLARRRQKASYDQQEDERKSTTSVSASVQESNTWGRSSWSNTANTFNSTTNTLRSSTTSVAQASVDEVVVVTSICVKFLFICLFHLQSADSEHNVTKFEAGGGSDDSDDGLSAWRF